MFRLKFIECDLDLAYKNVAKLLDKNNDLIEGNTSPVQVQELIQNITLTLFLLCFEILKMSINRIEEILLSEEKKVPSLKRISSITSKPKSSNSSLLSQKKNIKSF